MAGESHQEKRNLRKVNELVRSGFNIRTMFRGHENNIQTFYKNKLNDLYTSEPTILYFVIFSTTRFIAKINSLEVLLELSDAP